MGLWAALCYTKVRFHSSIIDDRWLLHPESCQSGMCSMSLSIPEMYEMYNLHLSTRCWTAVLHMTHRNTIYSGMVLSIFSPPGDSQVTSDCPEAIFTVSSWFNRISLTVSDAFITNVLHGNTEYLFSNLHCLHVNSNRIWGKPLRCAFMWCLDVQWR